MAFNYGAARETAKRLIENFGGAGSFVKKGATGGLDSSGNIAADIPDVIIDGIITPLLQYKRNEIDGTVIEQGDSYVFFHSSVTPEINMQTTLNNETFRAVGINKITSIDDINVYRKIQLRKN